MGAILAIILLVLAGRPMLAAAENFGRWPLNDTDQVKDKGLVTFDPTTSVDGQGALKVTAGESVVVRLFEVEPIDVDDARLVYRAFLKSRNLKGSAYLELWLTFPAKGRFFSRGLNDQISGDSDFKAHEIYFFLRPGENPDQAELNLVVRGEGTVWIDDVRLFSMPRK
jgi:hypothetical protein